MSHTHTNFSFSSPNSPRPSFCAQGSTFNQSESTVYPAQLNDQDENRDLLSIDIRQESGRLCYALTLLIHGMRLTVGLHTSLSLLLKSSLVQAPLYTLTGHQLYRVKELQKKRYETEDCKPSFKPLVMDIPDPVPYRPCSPTSSPPPPKKPFTH